MYGHMNVKCNECSLLHVQMRQIEILENVFSNFGSWTRLCTLL